MTIRSRLTQKEFIAANLAFRYAKVRTWISIGIAIVILIAAIVVTILYPEVSTVSFFILPALMLGLSPAIIYFQSRLAYKSNTRLQEVIEYDFGQDNLNIKGDSFSTTMTWEKIYKVKQTKNWLFIYSNRFIANPISKKDLFESDLDALKEILDRHKVKNNL